MPVTATSQSAPASHTSFLKKLGHMGLDCFTKVIPFITKQAQVAEPVIDLLFPVQGGIFSTVVNAICMAEVSGAQAANNAQNGPQKLQAVITTVGPQLLELAKAHGLTGGDADAAVNRYVQAIFDLLDGPVKAGVPSSSGTSVPAESCASPA